MNVGLHFSSVSSIGSQDQALDAGFEFLLLFLFSSVPFCFPGRLGAPASVGRQPESVGLSPGHLQAKSESDVGGPTFIFLFCYGAVPISAQGSLQAVLQEPCAVLGIGVRHIQCSPDPH